MKTDARILHTRKALRNALLSLLPEKSVDTLTVKEVCEKANVSRATFYKHYKDCFDLLKQMESCMLEKYLHALNITNPVDVNQLAEAVYDMVAENHELFQLVYTDPRHEQRIQFLISKAHDPCINCWKNMLKNITDTELEVLFSFIANGLVNTMATLYGKMEKDVLVSLLRGIMHQCMEKYL
ncbi:MAG: TetR/AcrR family transcriptional regulator [Clostridia bacterium]|nr:TetR/AcrR family transcriptional regulator [Clostridia bacterium]